MVSPSGLHLFKTLSLKVRKNFQLFYNVLYKKEIKKTLIVLYVMVQMTRPK